MKQHMKTMRIWSDRHQNSSYGRSQRSGEDHSLTLNKVEKMVLDMGDSMVSPRASTRPASVSATSGSRLSDYTSDDQAQDNVSPAPTASRRNSLVHQSPLQLSPSQRPDPALHALAAPSDREETHTTDLLFPSTSDESAQHWNEGDYMAVQPYDNLLYLDADLNSEAITGYINSSSSHIVAKLNHQFSQSVISEQQAEQLGLNVDYYDEEDEDMTIDFGGSSSSNGNGRQLVMGKVTFLWKNGQEQNFRRPLTVTCLVCEHVPFPLIFGQPFLRRRRHYWKE
jgi:hypothetical protein